MNFFRSRLSSVRRPDGFAIRRKKRFDLLSRGICNPPYPIDMPAAAWRLGIANPRSIKRLGHFLTADNISAGTPNGGKGISGATKFLSLGLPVLSKSSGAQVYSSTIYRAHLTVSNSILIISRIIMFHSMPI